MGTSYVTFGRKADADGVSRGGDLAGFWMTDGLLELWLRLLALHVEDALPGEPERGAIARAIRDDWLLASRGWFGGCVPHGLQEAVATEEGMDIVRRAICSLQAALAASPDELTPETLNLMGIERAFAMPIATWRLRDTAVAFLDLLEGRITSTNHDCALMPGSIPLPR